MGLARAFAEHLPPGAAYALTGDLEAALEERHRAGLEAWVGVALDPVAFAHYLAARTAEAELPGIERGADLYLACACALGVATAIGTFHRAFQADIARAAARIDPSPSFADDVAQAVVERLLVRADPGGPPPRITEYAGRASLRVWVAQVAKRTALNMRRNKGDAPHDALSSTSGDPGVVVGPELALLKARYKAEFESAIRTAMDRLSARERTLLLLHLVNGVTLPRLATMLNVSRATVARRLAAARETLHDETRRELLGRLRLSPSELVSVTALVRSQLEITVSDAVAALETPA